MPSSPIRRLLLCAALLLLAPAPSPAAPGDLDATFGTGGVVTTPGIVSFRAAVQADGKIVTAGFDGQPGGNGVVARYLANGGADASFAGTGKVTLAGAALDLAVQPDGKVLVVTGQAVSRFLTGGTPDATFGGTGQVTPAGLSSSALALQGDGKIIVAGRVAAGAGGIGLMRYLENGTPDASFGSAGAITTTVSDGVVEVLGVKVAGDGRIVVLAEVNHSFGRILVAAYLPGGTLDTSFGQAGTTRAGFSSVGDPSSASYIEVERSYPSGLAVQEDGKIVVVGNALDFMSTGQGAIQYAGVLRLTRAGDADRSFNGSGSTLLPAGLSGDDYALGVVVPGDGRLVVPVERQHESLAVHRLRSNGLLDPLFGTGGTATAAVLGLRQDVFPAQGVALDAEGRIVFAGDGAMARFEGGPPLPAQADVLATGTRVEGEAPGTIFAEFRAPAIDGGQLGGAASVRVESGGRQTVIYGDAESAVQVRTGGVDAEGGAFTSLGDPAFGAVGESIGFRGTARGAAQLPLPLSVEPHRRLADMARALRAISPAQVSALYSRFIRGGAVRRLAVQGGAAPAITGARVGKLRDFGVPRDRGGLVYTGKLARGNGVSDRNDFAIWRETAAGGQSELALRTSDIIWFPASAVGVEARKLEAFVPVQHATDQRRSLAADGTVGVRVKTDFGLSAVMLSRPGVATLESAGQTRESVGEGMDEYEIVDVRSPAVASGGYAAFAATLRSIAGRSPAPPRAVVRRSPGLSEVLLRVGDLLPGSSTERFSQLGDPLMGESGLVALVAALSGQGVTPRNRKTIMLVRENGAKTAVARLGDPAPGMAPGVTYRRFQSVIATDTSPGRVLFTGTVQGPEVTGANQQGLWAVDASGGVRLLLRAGQELAVGDTRPRIRLFTTLQASRANIGQGRTADASGFMTAKVKLSDGRQGVLRIPLP